MMHIGIDPGASGGIAVLDDFGIVSDLSQEITGRSLGAGVARPVRLRSAPPTFLSEVSTS